MYDEGDEELAAIAATIRSASKGDLAPVKFVFEPINGISNTIEAEPEGRVVNGYSHNVLGLGFLDNKRTVVDDEAKIIYFNSIE